MTTIGDYTLHAIETGRFGLDGGAMFGIVPKPLWAKRIDPDEQNRIPLAMRCLLLQSESRTILIDCGLGDTFDGTKYREIYAVDTEHSDLEHSLANAGVSREEITDVVLTHLHFDHCGGATRAAGDEREPTFPNAVYHVQRDHWQWAIESNPKEHGSFRTDTFKPLSTSGQVDFVDGEKTIFPGVDVMLVNGHTHAQQMVKITGPEGVLVYVADLLPTSHHLAPAWTMAYDVRPLVTIDEKQLFLEKAVEAEWNLFFEHDPDIHVASLKRTDRGITTCDHRPLRNF
ncbi:MBL fold metallo-hydrolase [Longibacter salinarum]|uniref:MBL fold metallo-hydrolase n=1 Tax=Longibacter salinarum TaxID=1850348 RepID=A0A2A8CZ81_9BACT|nr:MBL fold metallo-hydrolase [Longibacter salinarum]PEN14022.1 MBL fold metallo-hydrolase [Longibacter salinarum]